MGKIWVGIALAFTLTASASPGEGASGYCVGAPQSDDDGSVTYPAVNCSGGSGDQTSIVCNPDPGWPSCTNCTDGPLVTSLPEGCVDKAIPQSNQANVIE